MITTERNAAFAKLMDNIFEVPRKHNGYLGYRAARRKNDWDFAIDPNGPINPGGYRPEPANRTQALSQNAEDADTSDDDDPDKQQEDKAMIDPLRKLRSLDAFAICKQLAADGDAYSISEHELVNLISNYAKAHDTTFAKMFERNDDVGLALRKAVDIAKNAQFLSRTTTLDKAVTLAPRVTGGRAALSVNNPRDVMDDLQKLVDQQRAQNPTLSEAQAFARVYQDPNNKDLVTRERAANRPVSTGW